MGLIFCAAERNSSPIVLGSLWAKRERGTSGRPYTSVAGLGACRWMVSNSPRRKQPCLIPLSILVLLIIGDQKT